MADETTRITRDDLDAGLRSVVGEVEQQAQVQARRLLPVAIGAGVWLVAVWLIGRGARRFTRDVLAATA